MLNVGQETEILLRWWVLLEDAQLVEDDRRLPLRPECDSDSLRGRPDRAALGRFPQTTPSPFNRSVQTSA